ncbi:MAG: type II secretion system F family protein [Coriobacteriales bacterium]|nr:type II secretion system F family protein [Coriobacteriales bacterium]
MSALYLLLALGLAGLMGFNLSQAALQHVRRRRSGEGRRDASAGMALLLRCAALLQEFERRLDDGRLGKRLEPVYAALLRFASRLVSAGNRFDPRLVAGIGVCDGLTPERLPAIRLFFVICGMVLAVLLGAVSGSAGFCVVLLFAGAAVGWKLPIWLLQDERRRRRESCTREMPEMLDILALCIGAGMSFDAALEAYWSHYDSPLSQECRACHLDYFQGGMSREKALEGLAQRVGTDGMERFTVLAAQALRFGSAMERMLKDLATELRETRRKDVQEKVGKAPVRMLLPMGLLILPAMLILMLGPAVLNVLGGIS